MQNVNGKTNFVLDHHILFVIVLNEYAFACSILSPYKEQKIAVFVFICCYFLVVKTETKTVIESANLKWR